MRGTIYVTLPFLLAATIGCGTGVKGESSNAGAAPPPIAVSGAAAVDKPIRRFLEVTGTLAAQEEAEVAAEVQGRVIATPVERGTRVGEGDPLIRISSAEMEAQVAEADANAAQIVGRLGLADGSEFAVDFSWQKATSNARKCFSTANFSRKLISISAARKPKSRGVSTTSLATAPCSSIRRCSPPARV